MRIALALVVIAIACASALYVHKMPVPGTGYCNAPYFKVTPTTKADCWAPTVNGSSDATWITPTTHPHWEDPVALLLVIGGFAGAAAIFATSRSAQHA